MRFQMKLLKNNNLRMGGLALIYLLFHPGTKKENIPYWYRRSLIGEVWHLIRKGICQNIAPNCVLNPIRITLYRLCGFEIGKGCFIGMKCYFDDLCVDKIRIGNNVTISYGVYFACHGCKQGHNTIEIRNGAYIGMRATVIARYDIVIGEGTVVGAMTLVNKSVPDGVIVVGVPCKTINSKTSQQLIE